MTPNEPTCTGVAAWASLMDPDLCSVAHVQPRLYLSPGSLPAPVSEQGAASSAGVAVSLPRPIFLADDPDLLEGSGHE
jgi:hypothetical protein